MLAKPISRSLAFTSTSLPVSPPRSVPDSLYSHVYCAGDPTVACVWRRQTFSAAVDQCSPEMTAHILNENIPSLAAILCPDGTTVHPACLAIMDAAYSFSRMLHGSRSTSGGAIDAFYRGFVPELGSVLYPRQIELVKRCIKSERGEQDRVGSTVFPGLVKVSRGVPLPDGTPGELVQTVVRRAQCVCECAMLPQTPSVPSPPSQTPQPGPPPEQPPPQWS